MPVLAIPYLVPFANAAGIVIGSVATAMGLSALSDKVQDYMEENPENSLKILAMIMPAEGLIALFNKEADEGEEVEGEEIIDLDEDKPKSKKSKKQIILEELGKEKGSYASPEAEGSWASGRGRIIRRLREEGHIPDKPDPDYDPDKKYKGYKRFTRKKADGGRIGFVEGGWADDLTGQGLATYNSMTAAGHTDQTIQDTLTELGYWPIPAATGIETIVNTGPDIGGGGGGDGGSNISTWSPNQNLGTTNITDYEAEAYGIGPTWAGSWAKIKDDFSRIPTPFNLARMGINKFQDWQTDWQEKRAAKKEQELQAEIDAANKAALASIVEHNIQTYGNQDRPNTGINAPGGGKGQSPTGGDVAGTPFDRGGLATMFERRR